MARPRFVLLLAALTAAYFVAGKLSLQLAFLNPSASPVWPPTGLALAALLLLGYRVWPAILIGAFLVNVTTTGSVATSVAIAVGNTLEALAGAYLVHRFAHGRHALDRAPDLFRFVILAVAGSTLIAATIGALSLAAGGFLPWQDFRAVWLTWWLGDMVANITVAPLILVWAKPADSHLATRSLLEVAALFASVIVVGSAVFAGTLLATVAALPVDFLCIPVLIWAAYRFGQREAVAALVVLSGIAIWGTLNLDGPFARYEPNQSLLLLQAFLGASAVMTLALSALVNERRGTTRLLADRVDERTRDLREAVARLQEAQEALVRHEKLAMLGQVAGGVGHELRNPLGVMSNAVYYLRQVLEGAPPNVGRYLDILRDQIEVSDRIIANLLDLGRGQHRQRDEVALPDIVAVQLAHAGSMEGITVELHVPADLPPALGDPVQVGQIVLNLVSNAIQAMDQNGGTLTIRARQDGQRLIVEVADTGPGVPEANLEKIFEPLFTTKARGMGLGLAVSRSLARANDAELTVTSAEGQGTTFTLVLPVASR